MLLDEGGRRQCADYHDTPSAMTSGRLVARFLSRFSWYYPTNETDHSARGVSLDRAWAYYEHVTLGRIYADDEQPHNQQRYIRAPPGESTKPTKLYPLIQTPTEALKAFGVSVRLYFSTLLVLAAFLGMAAVLNFPLGYYFSQADYSADARATNLVWAVQASAVCADTEWVTCDDSCQDHLNEFKDRVSEDGSLFLKNTCDFDGWLWPGIASYVASLLLIVQFGVAFFWLQRRAEIVFDEEVQTASDYSLKVSNPPANATDPKEWKTYFETFGKVALVTVTVNNASLLQKLVQRRRLLRKLKRQLNNHADAIIDWNDEVALRHAVEQQQMASLRSWGCGAFLGWGPSASQRLLDKILSCNQTIHAMITTEQYRAVAVFVTFETERAQRNALHVLSTGKLQRWRNELDTISSDQLDENGKLKVYENAESSKLPTNINEVCMDPEKTDETKEAMLEAHSIKLVRSDDTQPEKTLMHTLRFRGDLVLHVKEAPEPSDVRWRDLEVSSTVRGFKFLGSLLAMIAFITWSALLIWDVEMENPGTMFTPLFITLVRIYIHWLARLASLYPTNIVCSHIMSMFKSC